MVVYDDVVDAITKELKGYSDDLARVAVKSYFNRMQVPKTLQNIDLVANEMNKVISVLECVAEDKDKDNLNIWQDINSAIRKSYVSLKGLDVKLVAFEKKASIHGYKKSNSLYSVLWYLDDVNTYSKQYVILKSVLFRIWNNLIKYSSLEYAYESSCISRRLGEERYKDVLFLLPDIPQSVESYVKSLEILLLDTNFSKIKGNGLIDELLRCILISEKQEIFSYRDNDNKEGAGGNGGGIGPGVIPSKQRLEYIDSIEDDSDGEFKKINILRLTEFDDDSFSKGDFDQKVNDYVDEFDVLELVPRADDYLDLDPKLEALRLAGIKSAMAMQSHFLPTHRSELSLWEVGNIFSFLNLELMSENSDILEIEILIILSLILVLGRDIGEICGTKIIKNKSTKLPYCGMAYVESDGCIKVSVSAPEYKTNLTDEQKFEAISVDNELILFLPNIVVNSINKIIKIKKEGKTLLKRKLFYGEKEQYIKSINNIIRKKSESGATYVALKKFIFQRILSKNTDLVDPMMITDQRYGVPGSRLHYATKSKIDLNNLHTDTFNDFISEVAHEFDLGSSVPTNWKINIEFLDEGYVGAKITPKVETVKNLISGLKERIKQYKNIDWIDYHNVFTAYCILMLDFATGTRSVARKYFFKSDLDLLRKQILVWDKSAGDSLNSRIAYLPDICVEQLREYYKYRDYVIKKISGVVCSDYQLLSDKCNQNPTSYFKSKLRKHVEEYFGQFFFLSDTGKPLRIKRELIQEQIKGLYHLPLNTNRHYLRFFLMLNNIPGEIIDAYLGHSSNGEEPYGRYSFLTLDEVIVQVKPCIDNMFSRDGWSVIKGVSNDY